MKTFIFIFMCFVLATICFVDYSSSYEILSLMGGFCWSLSGLLKFLIYLLENEDDN